MPRLLIHFFSILFILLAAVAGILYLRARPAAPHPFYQDAGFRIIAHRGGAGLGPENTISTFRRALIAGADVLEMDVRTTTDGHLVVLHDATVDRTTNGTGPVAAMTLAKLKELDAGYRWSSDDGRSFPFRNRRIAVPSMEEVLTTFADTPLVVEIKENNPTAGLSLCRLLKQHNGLNRVLVASVHARVLKQIRRDWPQVATSATPGEAFLFDLLGRLHLTALARPDMQALQVPPVFRGRPVVTERLVAAAHRQGLKVEVWTVNEPAPMAHLLAAGVDGIITDLPDRLARIARK